MGPIPAGDYEARRIAALRRYRILDTPQDTAFDRITRMAARLFRAPVAIVSFVDTDRQFLKSRYGLDVSEIPSLIRLCRDAIGSDEVSVIPDTLAGEPSGSAPIVGGVPVRFYAAAPLITPEGFRLGVLAVMDTVPRPNLGVPERATLTDLAAMVMNELQSHMDLERVRDRVRPAAAAEARLEAFMESASQGILAVNQKGQIEIVNQKLLDLFGYSRHELVGQSIEMLIPESFRTAHQSHRQEYFSHPHARPMGIGMDLAGLHKNGQQVAVEISLNHVDAGGQPLAFGFVTDITARLRLEQQLRQSQKMEAIGQLAGGVAHDFNNLLTIIQGYSSMSLDGLDPADPLREPLEEIEKAALSAATLTRQLLAFSRRNVVRAKILNLNTVIGDMEKMLRRVIGEDIQLMTVLGDELDDIFADPGLIEQILMNIVVNARDAMPDGGKLLLETGSLFLDREYAGAHLAVKTGRHTMLAITDTGTGMSEEVRARIFEPFFTTKAQGHGTGLGLATVYGIVQQMQGTIWVYSEPGRGTTFKVLFPSAVAGQAAETEQLAEPVGVAAGETILLVEDEAAVRKFVRSVLERLGYSVLEAEDVHEIMQLAADTSVRIDLLLTDVIMPQLNGKEIAARISEFRPAVPVLYMSGYTDRAIQLQDDLATDKDFIQKPFTPGTLAQKLRVLLSRPASSTG
jgi:PAS domain S-box-containing protein